MKRHYSLTPADFAVIRHEKFFRRLAHKRERLEARLGRPLNAAEGAELEEWYGYRISLRVLMMMVDD